MVHTGDMPQKASGSSLKELLSQISELQILRDCKYVCLQGDWLIGSVSLITGDTSLRDHSHKDGARIRPDSNPQPGDLPCNARITVLSEHPARPQVA